MKASVTVSNSVRLLAFESALSTDPVAYGCCSDCGIDDLPLIPDPNPELEPDAYCVPCTRGRVTALQQFLNGARWTR